jgi:hypothetical protein
VGGQDVRESVCVCVCERERERETRDERLELGSLEFGLCRGFESWGRANGWRNEGGIVYLFW